MKEDWLIVSNQPTRKQILPLTRMRYTLTVEKTFWTINLVGFNSNFLSFAQQTPSHAYAYFYLKIGLKWMLRAFIKGYELIAQLLLSPLPDPELAIASRKQAKMREKYTSLFIPMSPLQLRPAHYEICQPNRFVPCNLRKEGACEQ